jgi:WD40 repeat protein
MRRLAASSLAVLSALLLSSGAFAAVGSVEVAHGAAKHSPPPCQAAFPDARSKTIGKTTWHNRQESVRMVVCNRFGLDPSAYFPISPSMVCGLVAQVIGVRAQKLAAFVDGACSGPDLAADPRDPVKYVGIACSWASDLLGLRAKGAGGILGSLCALAPSAGNWLGGRFESDHERDVAVDVIRHGKCIKYSPTHFGSPWLADDCSPGDKGFATLPVYKPGAPPGGPGGSGPPGGGPGSGETPLGGGSSGGGLIREAPLVSMLPAWTDYLYAGDLPGVIGHIGNGSEASSADVPPGTRVLRTGVYGNTEAKLVGVLNTPGTFAFHVTWQGPSGLSSGPFEVAVVPPSVTLPTTALEHLGVVADYGAWFDQLRPSPDKHYIAAAIGADQILVVYDVGDKTLTQLTTASRPEGGTGAAWKNLAWSPNGRYLAFTSGAPGPSYDIYLFDTATHGVSRLTENGGSYNPVWSPDGTLLAFNQAGNTAVYEPSTERTEVLPCPTWAGCHAVASFDNFSTEPWSVDSQHLTYQTLDAFSSPSGAMVWDRTTDSVRTLTTDATGVRLSADGMHAMVAPKEAGVVEFFNVASGAVEHTYDHAGLSADSSAMTMISAWSPDGRYVSAWRCANSHCGPSIMDVETGAVEDIVAPSGVNSNLAGWKGNHPLWCYDSSSGKLDCETDGGAPSSVVHLDTSRILSSDSSGYYGVFGGEYQPYAVATWNQW